jgi:hypothetical protein
VVHEVDEAADLLRVHLDVPALRAASHGTAFAPAGFLVRDLHVLSEIRHPLAAERPFAGGDPVGVERLDLGLEP